MKFFWSGRRESNPRLNLGRVARYHYATPAPGTPEGSFNRSSTGHFVLASLASTIRRMSSPPRVLLIGPMQGTRWRSISHYTATLAAALESHGVTVEVASAPWWNPPSTLAGLRTRWTRQPAIQAALRGEFDVVHLTDHALGHHVHRFQPHARVVVTCHDLMAFTVPGYFHGRIEGLVKRYFLRKAIGALKRADAVVAVSRYTAGAIESRHAAPSGRVRVIPNIVRPAFHPMPVEEAEALLAQQGIVLPPRPRILSVGHSGGYKNLPTLIAALAKNGVRDAHLIRVGGLRSDQRKLARDVGVLDRIMFLPGIDDPALAALMNACDALAQPSIAEGFGLPVAEAMACGLPVVASDGGALPEVADGAGLILPLAKGSGDVTASALADLLAEAGMVPSLRERGIARAAAFSAGAVTPKFIELYQSLVPPS